MSAAAPAVPLHLELDGQQARAVAALLRCLGRYGLAKTNLDDVAREAGCSRATLYRWVESKPELLRLAVASEEARVLGGLHGSIVGAPDLPEAIVAGVVTAARRSPGTTRCSSSWRTSPRPSTATSRSPRATRSMLRIADAIAPAFTPLALSRRQLPRRRLAHALSCAPTASRRGPSSISATRQSRVRSSDSS